MKKRYPFKFLDAYTREDHPFFFGRTEEIDELYKMVFQTNILLVYGLSGTGKTSLIQCGLASKFQSHDWLALNIRRGNNLNTSFEKALLDAGAGMISTDIDLNWMNQEWTNRNTAISTKLSTTGQRFRNIYLKHFKPIYLIFDQFEELYIRGDKNEEEQFIKTIQEILQIEQSIKIIVSIREEYLGHLYDFDREVPELLRKKLRVERMNSNKVSKVIKGVGQHPLSNVHLEVGAEAIIAENIFKAILGKEKNKRLFIELPYLQVFLDKLYLQITQDESRCQEAIITQTALAKMPDFDDVLRDFLEDQVRKIAQELKKSPELIWDILSPLVTLEGTKEPLTYAELRVRLPQVNPTFIDKVLEACFKSRVLRFIEDEQVYEVAHDSLARQIHARRSDEEIAILETQRMVKNVVSLQERAPTYFNVGQLRLIDTYVQQINLSEEEEEWIEQSRRHSQKELGKTRRQLRTVWILLIFAVLALIVAGYFWSRAVKAEKSAIMDKETAQRNLKGLYESEIKRLDREIEFERRDLNYFISLKAEYDVIDLKHKKIDSLMQRRNTLDNLRKQTVTLEQKPEKFDTIKLKK